MNRSTKLFQPINVIPKNATIKNHKITSKSQKVNDLFIHFLNVLKQIYNLLVNVRPRNYTSGKSWMLPFSTLRFESIKQFNTFSGCRIEENKLSKD